MIKIACIVGARPNFIKIAPIIRAFAKYPKTFEPVLVHTGQHYDAKLSDVFFRDLEIPDPHHYLNVGPGSQAQQTAVIIERFDDLCATEKFDRVLVVGDVTSTMACTISAVKRGIPVDHVEAGLRSGDRTMPEEINRMITDSISDTFFVTEPAAIRNLKREGHDEAKIKLVGNVMIDTLFHSLERAIALKKWSDFKLTHKAYGLVTLHRPSNVDSVEKLKGLLECLSELAKTIPLIFPVHPRTRKNLDAIGNHSLILCEPLGYLEFLSLMEGARLVLTDSGGIQEETTALKIPCLTLRNNTERPITVDVGSNTLIGEETNKLPGLVEQILAGTYKQGGIPECWDGRASERIVSILNI
jgi:UDP-N-acetylglucosamine 2-epimerase (non-hydrolysing)